MNRSPVKVDLPDLQIVIPSTAADRLALREARAARVEGILLRINELSATLVFPHLRQRRNTSAGREPFSL
jgi:hypothetical protein